MQLERYNGHIEDADFLSMLMVDIAGNIRSVSLPRGYVSDKVLADGVGFDASNYGYAKVNNSDMVAVPDMDTAFYEVRGDYRILHVLCDVVSTEREPFGQYPRNVVRAARDFLREICACGSRTALWNWTGSPPRSPAMSFAFCRYCWKIGAGSSAGSG